VTSGLASRAPVDRMLGTSSFAVSAAARAVAGTGRDVIRLELGEPDLPAPPHVVEALAVAARSGRDGYTEPAGDPAVRAALAGYYTTALGTPVVPAQLFLLPGSNMVLHLALLTLVGPGDEVLVPDPGYPVYPELVRLAGAVPVPYPLAAGAGFGPDIAELASLVTSRTRLLVLNFPNNPTGATLSPAAAEAVVALAHGGDFHVLRDEAYRTLNWSDPRGSVNAVLAGLPPDRTIVMDTLSKSHAMCGWRAGIGIVPQALVDRLTVLAINTTCCMPAFVQRAIPAALTAPEAPAWAAAYGAELRARRDFTMRALRDLPGLTVPAGGGAFYAFPDVRATGLSDVDFAHRLLAEAAVAVVPGSVFGRGGQGHVRLAYTQPLDRLRTGLSRLRRFLEDLR
jgi:aspartate/methionine/tyrosine aminotransferase